MRIDLLSIFPDFFLTPLQEGIIRRAREAGLLDIGIHNIRSFAKDRHQMTDDRPYGGGEGMVMKPEPLTACLKAVPRIGEKERIIKTKPCIIINMPKNVPKIKACQIFNSINYAYNHL